ncbi:MAG: hypothetical protein ACFFD7_11030 [Candidatus Thorarchaeota archaeon]
MCGFNNFYICFQEIVLHIIINSSELELFDLTDEFIGRFEKLSNKSGFGGTIWTISTFGAGKSALLCILCNLLLTHGYETRNVALYQAPKKLLEAIQKAVPREFKHKFRIVEQLSEVRPFDIFCIDEGYLSADAKNALTRDSQNFIESLTTLRHSSVFTILNSPDDGILRGYRLKSQFRFYKLLPDGYIDEVNDRFAKKYGDIITNLTEEQTIFQITHIDFLKKGIRRGALVLPLKKYCPWYNEQIFRNFEGEDFDAYMRKLRKKKDRMEAVIQLLIDEFRDDLNRKRAEGFLFDEHLEIFRKFESDIGNMVKVALYRLYLKQIEDEEDYNSKSYELEIPSIIMDPAKEDVSCANFFRAYYFNNMLFNGYKKVLLNTIYLWIIGFSQRKIAFETGYGLGTINKLLQDYNSGEGLSSDLLRIKTVYEFWVAKITVGHRDGGKSIPDTWYNNDKNEIIGCGECKLIDDLSSTLTFYQKTLGNKKRTLEPSYNYCKENNIQYYPFYLRNPKWGNFDLVIPIEVDGNNKITVSKANIKEYILPGGIQTFNSNEFFEHQELMLSCIN